MDVTQKLKLIKTLSGFSQEQLARELNVSFPTLNSWINGKSKPHKDKIKRINKLYGQWTGQKEAFASPLLAKKEIIEFKRKRYKNILDFIHNRADLRDQFILSLTYNTNRIEGSTLTEPETAAILFQNTALPNKTLVEQMEAKNHQAALTYLFQSLAKDAKINESLILKLHSILFNGIQTDAGEYRQHGVRIVGVNVPTANYMKVPSLIKEIISDIAVKKDDVIGRVSQIHSRFEQIHPFSDGNGRIGRLLIQAMLLRKNYPPAVIKQEKKRFYMTYLNKSQLKNDFAELKEFVCDAVLEGYRIIEKGR